MKTLLPKLKRLNRLHHLVLKKATGPPKQLARQLGIAESTVYDYVNVLRDDFAAPIHYSEAEHTYLYLNPSYCFEAELLARIKKY